ncbi:hypothetical protein GW17_00041448 [Ensete ventricosum]|nr:hypothetical protein GW17_00041448 [Ensete ventricosum]
MQLGTRQECVESSSRVSEVCQDGTREFAKRRPRLAERLSGVAEKLTGIHLQPITGHTCQLWSPAAAGRCLLLFPTASAATKPFFIAVKPSSTVALISSSLSLSVNRCHLLSQLQPPPSVVPAPCFLYRCNLLLGHRGTLALSSSPAAVVAPKCRRDCCPSYHGCRLPMFLPFSPPTPTVIVPRSQPPSLPCSRYWLQVPCKPIT